MLNGPPINAVIGERSRGGLFKDPFGFRLKQILSVDSSWNPMVAVGGVLGARYPAAVGCIGNDFCTAGGSATIARPLAAIRMARWHARLSGIEACLPQLGSDQRRPVAAQLMEVSSDSFKFTAQRRKLRPLQPKALLLVPRRERVDGLYDLKPWRPGCGH